jgi:hypothetical protein
MLTSHFLRSIREAARRGFLLDSHERAVGANLKARPCRLSLGEHAALMRVARRADAFKMVEAVAAA